MSVSTDGEMEFVDRPVNRKVVSALSLRVAGANLEEICQVVGFASPEEAGRAIDRALKDNLKADPNSRSRMREIANRRLETLLRSVWKKATDPKDPEHLQAVSKAKDIIDRHVKLFGLDAPAEMVVHSPSASELEQWVSRILAAEAPQLEEADILDGEVIEGDFGG